MFAQNSENLEVECSDNQAEDESCIRRFKRFDNYENSVIVDPIERESLNMRPSSKESSFYEQMTR